MIKYITFAALFSSICFSSVDHKDEFIDSYLANISTNMDEKTEILPYICENGKGVYLDIGTGGDAIACIAKQLDPDADITLIAADIDPLVLEAIKKRQSEITFLIGKKDGLRVDLMTMSAVDMHKIQDSSLAGIGASALTHEVYSYVPTLSAIDQFAKEVCRSLDKDGVFIYRDPKWVDNPDKISTLVIKTEIGRYYSSLFLAKFFDRELSLIRDYKGDCCKPKAYNQKDIFIHAYTKKDKSVKKYSLKEFLATPSSYIDYDNTISLEAPLGLIAELERHYVMYLKDYFTPGFFDTALFNEELPLKRLSTQELELLDEYVVRKNIAKDSEVIAKDKLPIYLKELNQLRSLFRHEHKFSSDYKLKTSDLGSYYSLVNYDSAGKISIDPKLLVLLFQGKSKGLFSTLHADEFIPWDVCEHLKMEGEEHYYYKTTAELVLYFGQISNHFLKDSDKSGYILAPISLESIKTASRDFYKNVLDRDFEIFDLHGNKQSPATDKNIIHFKLQPKEQALKIYNKLIENQPELYKQLKKWAEKEFNDQT